MPLAMSPISATTGEKAELTWTTHISSAMCSSCPRTTASVVGSSVTKLRPVLGVRGPPSRKANVALILPATRLLVGGRVMRQVRRRHLPYLHMEVGLGLQPIAELLFERSLVRRLLLESVPELDLVAAVLINEDPRLVLVDEGIRENHLVHRRRPDVLTLDLDHVLPAPYLPGFC